MKQIAITKRGKDLKVGDVIEVWWKPHKDRITELTPYEGPLDYLWKDKGGAQIAKFEVTSLEMTIEPQSMFQVHTLVP
jgi:hypothetical protein